MQSSEEINNAIKEMTEGKITCLEFKTKATLKDKKTNTTLNPNSIDNVLMTDDVVNFSEALKKHSSGKLVFYLSSSFSQLGSDFFFSALSVSRHLTELVINSCDLKTEDFNNLFDSVSKSKLEVLNISGNYMNNDSVPNLCKLIQNGKYLTSLKIDLKKFEKKEMKEIMSSIENNTILTHLDITSLSISNFLYLHEKLKSPSLEYLFLMVNNACISLKFDSQKVKYFTASKLTSDYSAQEFGRFDRFVNKIKSYKELCYFTLNTCNFSHLTEIFKALDISKLEMIDLKESSHIKDIISKLCKLILNSKILGRMCLNATGIDESDVLLLLEALRKNRELFHLDLEGNSINKSILNEIDKCLKKNQSLREATASTALLIASTRANQAGSIKDSVLKYIPPMLVFSEINVMPPPPKFWDPYQPMLVFSEVNVMPPSPDFWNPYQPKNRKRKANEISHERFKP